MRAERKTFPVGSRYRDNLFELLPRVRAPRLSMWRRIGRALGAVGTFGLFLLSCCAFWAAGKSIVREWMRWL